MNIKEALKEAIAMLDGIEVKGKTNMTRMIIGMERIQSVINAIENAEKEDQEHEDHHDQQREDA